MKITKASFLKQAKEKYKQAIEEKFVAEMNFIFSSELILRVWFDHSVVKCKTKLPKNGETGFMHKWCTVQALPIDEDKKLIRKAGQILCADNDEEMVEMIGKLRQALKTSPNETADYIDGVTMWEKVEYSFTVEGACEYIGIKLEGE